QGHGDSKGRGGGDAVSRTVGPAGPRDEGYDGGVPQDQGGPWGSMAAGVIEDGPVGAVNGALRAPPPSLLIGAPTSLHSRLEDLAIDGGQGFPDYQQPQQQ
ncbi:unnamed protein product, partial [Laminaria digitata]